MTFAKYAGTSPQGVAPLSSPSGASGTGPGGWHPTVLYMLGLVIVEIILVGVLSRTVLK